MALEILDLSWNHLKRKGTVALGTGLRVGTLLFCDTLVEKMTGNARP